MKLKMFKTLSVLGAACMLLQVIACANMGTEQVAADSAVSKVQIAGGVSDIDVKVRSAVQSDGFLKLNIIGTSASTQTVYLKVMWFDADGMVVSTRQSDWQLKKMIANVPFAFMAIAPSARVKDYRIIITDDIGDGLLQVGSSTVTAQDSKYRN